MFLFSRKIKENKCCLSTIFDNVHSDNACLRCDLPIISDRNFLMVLILVSLYSHRIYSRCRIINLNVHFLMDISRVGYERQYFEYLSMIGKGCKNQQLFA